VSDYTIEPHGDAYALYVGRDSQHHGLKLAHISEPDAGVLVLDLIVKALNAYQPNTTNKPIPTDSEGASAVAPACTTTLSQESPGTEREGEARVPDGFAVVMENNAFVGLYHWPTAAEQLATKSPGWRVRPMIFAD